MVLHLLLPCTQLAGAAGEEGGRAEGREGKGKERGREGKEKEGRGGREGRTEGEGGTWEGRREGAHGNMSCFHSIAAVCEGEGQTDVESCYHGKQKNRAAGSGIRGL